MQKDKISSLLAKKLILLLSTVIVFSLTAPAFAAKSKFGGFNIIWPTDGLLSSTFGMRILGPRKKMHSGIDISAPVGKRIYASADGQIVFAGRKSGYGYTTIIKHNSKYETLYAHMSILFVQAGEFVRRGEVIGYVGKSGHVTGANLHYETRVNGKAQNPLTYLPPAAVGAMRKGMHTPSYAFQLSYYHQLKNYAYNNQYESKGTKNN